MTRLVAAALLCCTKGALYIVLLSAMALSRYTPQVTAAYAKSAASLLAFLCGL